MKNELYEINIDKLCYSLENGKDIIVNEYIEEYVTYNKLKYSIETFNYYINNLNVRSTEGFKDILSKIWNWFKGICLKVWAWIKKVWKWFIGLFKTKSIKFKDVVKWLDLLIPELNNDNVRDELYEFAKKTTIPSFFKSYNDYYNDFTKKIVENDIANAIVNETSYYNEKRNGIRITKNYSIKDSFEGRANKILNFLDNVKRIFESNGKSNQINNEISLFNGKDFTSDDFNAIANYSEETSLVKIIFEREFNIEFQREQEDTSLIDILGIHINYKFTEALMVYRKFFDNKQLLDRSYKYDASILEQFNDLFKQVIKKIDEVKTVSMNNDNIDSGTSEKLNETVEEIGKFIQAWSSYISNTNKLIAEYIKMKFYIIDMIINALALTCGNNDKSFKFVKDKYKYAEEYPVKFESDKIASKPFTIV